MAFQDLEFMWDGGTTERFHSVPTLNVDTVGHHSYNVACILMRLRPETGGRLLRAALKHDMAEHITGDMPAPTKRSMPDYHERRSFREEFAHYENALARGAGVDLEQDLPPEEAWVLKFADSADGLRFCINEAQMGNRHRRLIGCGDAFSSYMCELLFGRSLEPIERLFEVGRSEHAQDIDADFFSYLSGLWEKEKRNGRP